MEQNNTEDDKPIYMIAEAEKGDRDYYGDFNYGFCPLRKYASGSKMTETKKTRRKPTRIRLCRLRRQDNHEVPQTNGMGRRLRKIQNHRGSMELHTPIPIIHPYKDNYNNPSLEIHKGQKGGINILRKPTIIEKTNKA